MAYTLKDWDRDIQASEGMFLYGLEVFAEADAPNEELFRAIYEKRRAAWVGERRSATERYIETQAWDAAINPDEWIAWERKRAAKVRALCSYDYFIANSVPLRFDEGAAKRHYAARYRRLLASLPESFPAPVLPEVADIRLLALRVVSPHVMALLKQYQAECRERREREQAAHRKRYHKLIAEYPKFKHFHYHDWEIVSFRREKRDMVIKLESYDKVTFKNATILRRDGPLRGWMWHSAEVRPLDHGFEVEMLAWGRDTRLVILRCDDVEMERVPDGTPGYAIPGHEDGS